MPDYDLRGLSARSFEQLVQALSTQVLGPGVVIFGDGPDGGREATFEGKVPFPTQAEQWDGYIVVQAKFRARTQTPARDGAWLKKELRKELAKFSRRRLRRPDYYILCTNVVLTPADSRGAKDATHELLAEYRSKLGLKDFAVWDYDQIRSFLDSYAGVRQTYAAWVTPGDVLTEILRTLQFERVDFSDVVHNFLQKELLADRFANLEQAGYKADDRIPLGQVFVDLPVSTERFIAPPPAPADTKLLGCVSTILAESAEKLSESCRPSPERRSRAFSANPGRFVIIGGPGQGKSTVGQFLCQMYRAALIAGRPKAKLSRDIKETIAELKAQTTAEALDLPVARRFPLRVVLSEFADSLAPKDGAPVPSLLAYIAQRMSASTGYEVSTHDVRVWLAAYPWFLVLDGLDEVPASGNRDLLLSKIQDFWIDAADADGDVLVLATTRPQGYSDDFSQRHYQHIWLAPLSPRRALGYASRFTEARFGNDPDRLAKVMRRLRRAASHDATARLMQSPLQVTIMAILVDQGGEPPQERWRLFRQYYDVIYRREVERRIAAAAVLQEYQSDIDAIHTSVGLLLQVESERTGNADAKLPAAQFRFVVEDRLSNEGHHGQGLVDLTEKIIYAASQRLVFLVGLESGVVGFEIRSLQEFMAAEGFMAGADEDVANRLAAISPLASWRNVFLFAVGRCFAERQYMRDVVCNIAVSLNDAPDDRIARNIRAGSLLAADILEDGAARQQPKYHRQLARLAMRVLDVASSDVHNRLAKLYDESVADIYEEELDTRLAHQDPKRRQAAWNVIVSLSSASVPFATALIRDRWPADPDEQVQVLNAALTAGHLPRALEQHVIDLGPYLPIWRLFTRSMALLLATSSPDIRRWVRSLETLEAAGASERLVPAGRVPPFDLEISALSDGIRWLRALDDILALTPMWTAGQALATFLRSPDSNGLSRALLILAEKPEAENSYPFFNAAPWPFGSIIACANTREELTAFAQLAGDGVLGDADDWRRAERRWLSIGVTEDDVRYMSDDSHWPYDGNIATHGFPFQASNTRFAHRGVPSRASELRRHAALYGALPRSQMKNELIGTLLLLLATIEGEEFDRDSLAQVVRLDQSWYLKSATIRYALLEAASRLDSNELDAWWVGVLNEIGPHNTHAVAHLGDPSDLVAGLSSAVINDHSLSGLLHLLARYAESGFTSSHLRQLEPTHFLEGGDREAAIIIRVSLVSDADAEQVVSLTSAFLYDSPTTASRLLQTLSAMRPRRESTGRLALTIADIAGDRLSLSGLALLARVLTESLQSRRSNLDRLSIWEKLRLPIGLHRALN